MFSKVMGIGNLGREPEMQYLPNGTAVTRFNLAVTRRYKKDDGQKAEETIWFRCSAFGRIAETTHQFLKKGSKIYFEGELRGDENGNPVVYTRNDGSVGASFELRLSMVQFLDKRVEDASETQVPL